MATRNALVHLPPGQLMKWLKCFVRRSVLPATTGGAPVVGIAQLEEQVSGVLAEYFEDYASLVATVYNAASEARNIAAVENDAINHAGKLGMIYLSRLQGDLRTCQWAAVTGYALQAMTIAASIHELSYSLIYLGKSEERAKEWMAHDKIDKQYPECGQRQVIAASKDYFSLSQELLDREYFNYQQLCWAKHGNPTLQREYGISIHGDLVEVHQIPYFSPRTIRFGRFALFHACRAVGSAISVYVRLHLSEPAQLNVMSYLAHAGDEFQRLGARDQLFDSPA